MQDGGYSSTGEKFTGLGRGKVKGCWTSGNLTEETQTQKDKTIMDSSKVGRKLPHYTVDKTQVIQNFIDFIGSTVPDESGEPVSQLIIPMKNDWECDFLLDDFTDITRKDLAKDAEITKEDPRQKAKREYNHPKDVCMALIYVLIAKTKYDPKGFEISKIHKRPRW